MTRVSGTITPHQDKYGRQIRDSEGRKIWNCRFYDAGGKQRFYRRPFATEADARAWIAAQRSGDPAENGPTWRALHTAWENSHRTHSASQLNKVGLSVSRLLEKYGNGLTYQETTGAMIRALIADIAEKKTLQGKKPVGGTGAAHRALGHLKAIARWCRGQLLIPDSIPWEHLAPPEHKAGKRRPVPVEEIPAMIDSLDEWLRPVVLWICLTGCRKQDAGRLREEDILQDRVRVTVKAGRVFDYLLDDTLRAVLNLAKDQKERAEANRSPWVFVTASGQQWTKDRMDWHVRQQWRRWPWRLHSLRHTFATVAGRSFGADMVRAGLAHLARATSERYVHVSEDAQARHEVGAHVRDVLATAGVRIHGRQDTDRIPQDTAQKNAEDRRGLESKIAVEIDGRKVFIDREVILQLEQRQRTA